jgi:Secretion system C-terminal sorting domain
MRVKYLYLILFIFGYASLNSAQSIAKLSIAVSSPNELIIAAQYACHQKYGLSYPITYQLNFATGFSGLIAKEKHLTNESWTQIPEKQTGDLFNAIEAVRFDYNSHIAYVSVAFNNNSDSLFIELVNNIGNPVTFTYNGICKYYDNRKAVVTISSDDWSDWLAPDISPLMYMFRSRGLYLTAGIITDPQFCTNVTWNPLQQELDSGYVEAASHSRTHPYTPYADPVGEIVGSAQDIKSNLVLPSLSKYNTTEYVYTWIAPYGDFDHTVDSLLGTSGYLAARLYSNLDTTSPREYVYGDSTLTGWNDTTNHFYPFNPTVELGAPSWGGGDTSLTSLNGLFDTILAKGDVYHLMFHPQVIISDTNKGYLVNHLNYISGHSDVWYVNLGHLYLYHLIQEANIGNSVTGVTVNRNIITGSYKLSQNYPNPFNPATTINYSVPGSGLVIIKVYDILGREVQTLVNEVKAAGEYNVKFNAGNLGSGIYFYTINAGNFYQTRKMVLLK